MQAPPNIVLVGFMGTGKTSAGKAVAAQLGMTFVDMDDVLVERQGKPVARIFAEDGEPHFRVLERALVRELAGRRGLVIGTGGGVVLNPENIADFARTGVVICLAADPQTIFRRVEHDTGRPLLAGGDKLARIRQLYAARQPLYEAIPLRVETAGLTVEQAAARIAALHRAACAGGRGAAPR